MSLAFFAFGRGLGSSLRRSSGLGVLEACCTAAPGANATVTSHIGQRRAWCAQASTWCIALVLLDAGCCCWMPAAASRRSSTRRMLELQRFAAVHLGCQCCLQLRLSINVQHVGATFSGGGKNQQCCQQLVGFWL